MSAPGKTRAELRRRYKETPRQAGIFQVKNTKTGRIFLGSSTNLHGPLNRIRFQLSVGSFDNPSLQNDWNQFGPDAFLFEIVEVVKPRDDPAFCLDDELTLLEQIWLETLRPLGEPGYNSGSIRRM